MSRCFRAVTRPCFNRNPIAAACWLAIASPALAATYTVKDESELAAAISAVNASSGANFIELSQSIALTSALPPITGTVTIRGRGYTLDGQSQQQLLVVGADSGRRILVQINDLTLINGSVNGTSGGAGEGGGLGAGAALYVNSRADVVLDKVSVNNNTVQGGDGGLGVAAGTAGGYGEGGDAVGGAAGTGGGSGGTTGGGGGAGLGGGLFVEDGAGITLKGSSELSGNTVQSGTGAGDAGDGAATGSGIFLQGSGNLTFRVQGNQHLDVQDTIADASGSGLAGAGTDDRWNLIINGSGGVAMDPANPDLGYSYASVGLSGSNSFSGDVYVTGADVFIKDASSLGAAGNTIALDDGGLYMDSGLNLVRDIVFASDGMRIGVNGSGASMISGVLDGTGAIAKVGTGDLVLAGGGISGQGYWEVRDGGLVLDADSRLGTGTLSLNGGAVRFGASFDDLRVVDVGSQGGTIDNGGYDVTLANGFTGWLGGSTVIFSGGGVTTLTAPLIAEGDTFIRAGEVRGAIATGELTVNTGAAYALNGRDQGIAALRGYGLIDLGANTLTITLNSDVASTPGSSAADIGGTGRVVIERNSLVSPLAIGDYKAQALLGNSSYSGGTEVRQGAVVSVNNDSNLGTGPLFLRGGGFQTAASRSALDINISGHGLILTSGDLQFDGVVSGSGDLIKAGAGVLFLNKDNTYSGKTIVSDNGSYVAVVDPGALGDGVLQLTAGGGLLVQTDTDQLRPIEILDGEGVVNIGTHEVQSTGGITGLAGDSRLVKQGVGRLLLTGTLDLQGGVVISEGTLQVGNGGGGGDMRGDIEVAQNAELVIQRSGSLGLSGNITGDGSVRVDGPGIVVFADDSENFFLGGLVVENGLVSVNNTLALGLGDIRLDLDGGLVLRGDVEVDASLGSGGARLQVDGGATSVFDGDLDGAGRLSKTGTGTLVFTGVLGQGGGTHVVAGTLQVGEGLKGTLTGDVDVDAGATLVFDRDDLVLYSGVIDGDGTVIKRGSSELVLTGEQKFDGAFRVQDGTLRIGLGGAEGSLSGDVELSAGTKLVFDRLGDATFSGDTLGSGQMVKNGPDVLIVTGNLAHTGSTILNSGVLQVGDGGSSGQISGNVITGISARLVINRSDDVTIDANVSGAGLLLKEGGGVTTLTGTNTYIGGTIIEGGYLAIDSDARLGADSSKLTMRNGGMLRFLADFDLRDISLEPTGGGLDTNGFDIDYSGLISGSGNLVKEGAGRLTLTRVLVEGDVKVRGGVLQLGDGSDGSSSASALGNAEVSAGAELALNRNGVVNVEGAFTGSGTLRQIGLAELRLPGNSSAFAGTTIMERGSLRLDGSLGGDLQLAAGSKMQGNGEVSGTVSSVGASISPGNSIGTLSFGALNLDAGSVLNIEVEAGGAHDSIAVTGAAALDGTLNVLPQAGDYTAAGCCTYTILTASSVSGRFANVNNNLIFLNTSVDYQPTAVNIRFERNAIGFNTVSLTWNQQQVSAAIDAMEAADPSDPIASAIAVMSAEEARASYDALSGDVLLTAVNTAARAAQRFNHLLAGRSSRLGLASRGSNQVDKALQSMKAGGAVASPRYQGPTSAVEGLWVETAFWQQQEAADDAVGSASARFGGPLLALGADGYWNDHLIAGFGAGYLQGTLEGDNRQGEADVTGVFAGTYLRWDTGSGWRYQGALTLGQQESMQTRAGSVGIASGAAVSTARVMSVSADLEAGLALHVGNYGLRPFAVLNAQYLKRDAFTETGAGDAGLDVAAATDVLGEVGVGAELSRPWLTDAGRWAQLQTSLLLLQPLGDTQREMTARFVGAETPFRIKSTAHDSAALQLAAGGEWYISPKLALWGGYEGRFGRSTQEHNVVLSAQYRW